MQREWPYALLESVWCMNGRFTAADLSYILAQLGHNHTFEFGVRNGHSEKPMIGVQGDEMIEAGQNQSGQHQVKANPSRHGIL